MRGRPRRLRRRPSTAPEAIQAPSPGTPWWERWIERLQAELGEYRDLVALRRVETPEALLLQPQQQQLLRLQIKLRLLNGALGAADAQ